jgi:hypothetical protein
MISMLVPVNKIIYKYESNIAVIRNKFQSLMAIRAIGNAGYGITAIPTLTKCFKRLENPIEIRLSAIEAFRRIPCKADVRICHLIFKNICETF